MRSSDKAVNLLLSKAFNNVRFQGREVITFCDTDTCKSYSGPGEQGGCNESLCVQFA